MKLKFKIDILLKYILLILPALITAGCCSLQTTNKEVIETAWKDALTLPGWMAKDAKETISKKNNQILLLITGGASIAMNQGADKDIAEHQNKDIFHNVADRSLNLFGGPEFQYAAAGFWYLSSVKVGNQKIEMMRQLCSGPYRLRI